MHITTDEKKAIAAFKRLARRWPKTLWIFAGGQNGVAVLKTGQDGQRVMTSSDGFDPDYMVDTVDIPADGGDW